MLVPQLTIMSQMSLLSSFDVGLINYIKSNKIWEILK